MEECKRGTYPVTWVPSLSVVDEDTSSTSLNQQRSMPSLVPPLLHSFNQCLDSLLRVGIGTVDNDIVLLCQVDELVGFGQITHDSLEGSSGRGRERVECFCLLFISDDSSDGRWWG